MPTMTAPPAIRACHPRLPSAPAIRVIHAGHDRAACHPHLSPASSIRGETFH
jgi:hypothetical protein